ncbi:MAG: hypothetical protein ACYC91_07600 [Solirubrobacteraceae bacterium]
MVLDGLAFILFAERRRQAAGKPLVHYHKLVSTFSARYDGVSSRDPAADAVDEHNPSETWILLGSIPIGVGLAAFGYYVLACIAIGTA